MAQNSDFRCDRCGEDCGNGGVHDSLVVTDMDLLNGLVVNLNFCRTHYDDEGNEVPGCDQLILPAEYMTAYLESEPSYERPKRPKPDFLLEREQAEALEAADQLRLENAPSPKIAEESA